MEEINILYIDDQPDILLSFYLSSRYKNEKVNISYQSHEFKNGERYEDLLLNSKVKKSNVILIDSNLFENGNTTDKLFTGEEFRVILKQIYPYIETIVITQNAPNLEYGIISKFNDDGNDEFEKFYNSNLKPLLDQKIRDILVSRELTKRINEKSSVDTILLEKINDSLDGILEYKHLTSDDIKNLITEFKELKRIVNE
ncbi:hypothetical protein [Cetobacterium sp.]|uniref:hypothetical protein n=1 Tax=Cetobacterium sp. TaxID=2071632 RepID=UPI003EE73D6D